MKFIESKALQHLGFAKKNPKFTRGICILINYVIVIGGITWIVVYLIPELKDSVIAFINQLPAYTTQLNATIEDFFLNTDLVNGEVVTEVIDRMLAPLQDKLQDLPKLITDIAGNLYTAGRKAFDLIMAIFISFYMLFDKEKFSKQSQVLVYALFSEERGNKFFRSLGRTHAIFQSFIFGKALDSIIIGVIAFFGLSFIKAPFPLVLSLIIGVTNMIPYFGPFIGAIPAVIITLLVNPVQAIWVLLFILALQQFDGNYLGPKILGNSVDLSPIWIILAVTLGGALIGPLGMFIGVPIVATIKVFFNEFISFRFTQKYGDTLPEYMQEKENE